MGFNPNHPLVVNQKSFKGDGVYIGRGSVYGNPFVIGIHGPRRTVIAKHRQWCLGLIPGPNGEVPPTLEQIKALKGQHLICFCAPRRCHGDYYARVANPEQQKKGLFR